MQPVKLSFGIKKTGLAKPAAKKGTASVFAGADDDDEPAPSTSKLASTSSKSSQPRVSTATLSKAQKAKQAEELLLDSTVYEYDEVYDNMKEGSRQAELEKKKDAGDRKPKYISRLMETAEVRKRDRLRAEDKMVQRERQMEGEEFADKDAFVTPAYLAQQEELRRIEEEEKKKEEAQAGKAGGMTAFYKSYLDTTSKAHDAAVAASLSKKPVLGPSFNVEAPPPTKSEAQLAAEVSAQTGRHIEVNDDGVIIDKRQLMSGGLNVVSRPKAGPSSSAGGFAAPIASRAPVADSSSSSASPLHTGLSAAERGRQARERHSREIERQMVELEAKRKREAEEQLEQKVQKVAKRNDETKVEKLKRKAEERRQKREADAKAAAAAGSA
ncbi:coiled-coil domain-containing protein 55-domain containing protein [Leucosporidium creatinivorum]|uniref:Coiled-coil domain-containing protein 55-domain containing protein n=1 Tax=Leucosporidium creatinivorum TaxID=106004 RepID=A0A1Y2DMF2_9BASI|nr:coiled-coil domain-containing protein 55-domain containing protein [Leucosporidium creatinivorum]